MKIVLFIILFTIFTSMNSEVIWESDFGYFGADNAIIHPYSVLCDDGSYVLIGLLYYEVPGGGFWEFKGHIVKIDDNGNIIWTRVSTFDTYEWLVRVNGVIELANNTILTAGIVHANGYNFGYVVKRDSNGEKLWEIDMIDLTIYNLVKIDSTNFIVIGLNEFNNLTIRKLDSNANILWTRSYQISNDQTWPVSSTRTSDDGLIIIGRVNSYDSFTLKVNSQGDSLWSEYCDDNINNWIFDTSEGNIVILSDETIKNFDLDGNLIAECNCDISLNYGIDLPNENNFLASPSYLTIHKYDYELMNMNIKTYIYIYIVARKSIKNVT